MVVSAVSGRTYLSIGDVLSLLREEFPDVTISKIRFLESQGLVDPERSPSGYRKFYDDDVARLRWVLRKQRDQFLPLKVIRDRLAAAGRGVPPDDEPDGVGGQERSETEGEPGEPDGPDGPDAGAYHEGAHTAARTGAEASNGTADRGRDQGSVHADEASAAPSRGGGTAAPSDPEPGLRAVRQPVGAATAVADRTPTHAAASPVAGGEPEVPPHPAPAHRTGSGGPPPDASGPSAASPGAGGPAVPAPDVLSASVTGVSLSLAELCAATGLSPDAVASLESLGLLAPMAIAGGTYYDEEALTVGKLVVEFSRYGVEPRHLRMYRNATDREVGLVEQVITPLLRQRNPEARQRAVEAAADLARLGQSMRGSLVRSQLRRQLGG